MATRKQANKTWEELETIRKELVEDIFPKMRQVKSDLEQYREELFEGLGDSPSIKSKIEELETKIEDLKTEAQGKVKQILELHKKIFEGSTEEDSIQKQLETFLKNSQKLLAETEEKKESFDNFYEKVFGVKDKDGKLQGGIKLELEKYERQYEKLYNEIEGLLPGATSVGLVKVFEEKVTEYAKVERIWTWAFIGVAFMLSLYYGLWAFFTPPSDTIVQSFLSIFHKTPFLIFAIWLLIFIGNRRAENKKLEESYKQKETMARAYVGYQQHIEDLEPGVKDKTLLKKHMDNLLDAINENSAIFLSEEGDRHPFWSKFSSNKNEKGKETNADSE